MVFEHLQSTERIIVGHMKEIRGRRKLHNKEFHNLYSSPGMIRMIKLVG
jgi:hypothetical protein